MTKWLGVLVSLLFILLLIYKFQKLEWTDFAQALLSTKPVYFTTGVLLMVLSAFLQAVRWKIVLIPSGNYSYLDCFASVTIGHWFNVILPARLGELVRPFHFSKTHQLNYATVLATTLVERIFDAFAVLLLGAYCITILFFPIDTAYLFSVVVLYVSVLGGLFYVANKAHILDRAFQILPFGKWEKQVSKHGKSFFAGISMVNRPVQIFQLTGVTLLLWAANILSYWMLLKGTTLPEALQSLQAGTSVTFASAIAHAIPSSGSGLGVINYSVVVALENTFGVSAELIRAAAGSILSASWVIYIAAILPDIFVGGYFYWRDRNLLLSFKTS